MLVINEALAPRRLFLDAFAGLNDGAFPIIPAAFRYAALRIGQGVLPEF